MQIIPYVIFINLVLLSTSDTKYSIHKILKFLVFHSQLSIIDFRSNF